MVTAIVLALIVSVLAAGVLNLTMRRFELSALRTDHAVAMASAEAGFQYAFTRLANDLTFQNNVDLKAPGYYLIYCHANPNFPPEFQGAPDEPPIPALHVGNKHIAVRIRHFTDAGIAPDQNPSFATRPYKVRAVAVFGTGGS